MPRSESDRSAPCFVLITLCVCALDLTRATPPQLDGVFNAEQFGVSGDTRVKAKTFFIKAAQFADIPLSPLLLSKARSTSPRKRKPAAASGGNGGSSTGSVVQQPAVPHGQDSTSQTVHLSGGGSLTLIANVNLLTLTAEDRTFLFQIIDLMQKHGQKGSAAKAETPGGDTPGESTGYSQS